MLSEFITISALAELYAVFYSTPLLVTKAATLAYFLTGALKQINQISLYVNSHPIYGIKG